MAFAQLTDRESLRDIEICFSAQRTKLYHMGIRSNISRNTLSNANKLRDWRIYAELAQTLINTAQQLYADEDFGVDLDQTVYALDSTTIDLCLSVFPWANFRHTKSAIKLHMLLNLLGSIPCSSIYAMGSYMMLTFSTCCYQNQVFSTLWTDAIWISKDSVPSQSAQHFTS